MAETPQPPAMPTMQRPAAQQPKMPGNELIGRLIALEAMVVETTAQRLAATTPDAAEAALAGVPAATKAIADAIGHSVMAAYAKGYADELVRVVKERAASLAAK